jgi:hypothetical protein
VCGSIFKILRRYYPQKAIEHREGEPETWKDPESVSDLRSVWLRRLGLKNEKKTALVLGPLILGSLLVAGSSKRNRIPGRQDSEPQLNYNPQIPLLTSSSTATDSRETYETPATRRWKGLPETILLVVAFGLLLLSLWQSRTASRSIQKAAAAMQSTTETMTRQLELSERPWVSINASVVTPLTYNSEGVAQVTLQLAIRNVGSTPAKGLSLEPKMFIASLGDQDPVMVRSSVCDENRRLGIATDGTLFPTMELTRFVTFHADAKELVKESKRTGSFSPALVACASYRSTFDDRSRYTTGVIYYLRRIDPARPGMYLGMTNGMQVPRDLLVLKYDPIGETVAN